METRTDEVTWTCPHCSAVNLDSYTQTAFPLCENCNKTVDWEEFLTDEQLDMLNKIMIKQESHP